jgi:hypothetical protein
MTEKDVEDLKINFPLIYNDPKTFTYCLQKGKPLFDLLMKYKNDSLDMYNKYLSHLRYIGHYSSLNGAATGNSFNPPFNTKISMEFPRIPDPHYVQVLFKNKKLDENELTNLLKKIYFDYYYNNLIEAANEKTQMPSLANKALDSLMDRVDSKMLERTKVFLDYLKMNNLGVTFEKEKASVDTAYIFDKLLIKGVHQERTKNYEAKDYILVDVHEDMGIRYFMHKYFTGYATRYLSGKDFMTSMVDIDQDRSPHNIAAEMKEANMKFILRVTLFIKHPYKLKIGNALDYPTNYTYSHLAVFENELISPHPSFIMEHDFEQWLTRHEIDDSNWKLVDADNFMKGNSFFRDYSSFQEALEDDIVSKDRLMKFIEQNMPDFKIKENKPAEGKEKVDSKDKKKQQAVAKKDDGKDIVASYRVKRIKEYSPSEVEKLDNVVNVEFEKVLTKEVKIDDKKLNDVLKSLGKIVENKVNSFLF